LRQEDRKVLVIVGPTGAGKTSVSLLVAERLDGEIISADARQIYRFLDIGTAKPKKDELRRVRHHFVDSLDPDEEFSAGEYGRQGRKAIDRIFARGRMPIVVSGSGLYLRSLVDGLFEGPSADDLFREHLSERLRVEGSQVLLEELAKVDPVSAAKMLPSNRRRITRALEVYHLTGEPISSHHRNQKVQINFRPIFVGLEWERGKLYDRINHRVELMLEAGLVEEVARLKALGYHIGLKSLQTVGYQEIFSHFSGEIDHDEMVRLIKRNTRRYAKRQLSWFRNDKRIKWLHLDSETDLPRISDQIVEIAGMG
jgi:tRNA dimethylallyltransferase